MSFPSELKRTFTSSEMMFVAENDLIEVISKVRTNEKLLLITTDLPKLRLMASYKIPIWLAVILRKQNKITVTPPNWLTEKYFIKKYNEELENPSNFAKMPDKWLEISKIFLSHFSQDLLLNTSSSSADSGLSLSAAITANEPLLKAIQDLRELRLIKLRKGLSSLNELNLSFNDFSLMEINEFRPFICNVMSTLNRLDSTIAEEPTAAAGAYDDEEDEEVDDMRGEDHLNAKFKRVSKDTGYRDDILTNSNSIGDSDALNDANITHAEQAVDSDVEMNDLVNEFEL